MGKKQLEYNQILVEETKLNYKLKDLQEKIDNKNITKEEYEEYKKSSKIKENIHKVKNILEYRDIQKTKLETINKILEGNEEIEKETKECEELKAKISELDSKANKLVEEKEILAKKIKANDIKEEDKKDLMEEMLKKQEEIEKNNGEYVKFDEELKSKESNIERLEKGNEKLKNVDKDEVVKTKMKISQTISKCNMIANNLMKGRNWDYIEIKLDNWKDIKLTSKTKLSEKADKIVEETIKNIAEKEMGKDKQDKEMSEKSEKASEENKLQKVSEFDLKHPMLAKIKNWFKSIPGKIKGNKANVADISKDTEKEIEKVAVEDIQKGDEDFKEYIKQIAEKGIKEVQKEKLKEHKRDAHKRETEKFGKDYADKSSKFDEKDER